MVRRTFVKTEIFTTIHPVDSGTTCILSLIY